MKSEERLADISRLAIKALFYELTLTPKPGLVDRLDQGAHDDMDFYTFLDSSLALSPFFNAYIQTGWTYHHQSPQLLFEQLRILGIEAEKAMFSATKGVNTHKGVNFSFALLLGATGAYLAEHQQLLQEGAVFSPQDSLNICRSVSFMTESLLGKDLGHLQGKDRLTHGERLFLRHGIKGPRGEAASGYPSISQKALPFLRQEVLKEKDPQKSQLRLLLYLMTFAEDGNLIYRGGLSAWRQVQKEAQTLLEEASSQSLIEDLSSYNRLLIKRHLSPGGAADLLSLTLYFAFLEGLL